MRRSASSSRSSLRADWRQEWESELRFRERRLTDWDRLDWRNKLDLVRRSSSAFWDALWLQQKRLEADLIQDLRSARPAGVIEIVSVRTSESQRIGIPGDRGNRFDARSPDERFFAFVRQTSHR